MQQKLPISHRKERNFLYLNFVAQQLGQLLRVTLTFENLGADYDKGYTKEWRFIHIADIEVYSQQRVF